MSKSLFIPPATAAKLAEPIAVGGRHKAAMDIALPLIGNGFAPEAVFAQLRAKFEADKTDEELWGVVKWAVGKNPDPSGFGAGSAPVRAKWVTPEVVAKEPVVKKSPTEHAAWWLSGAELTLAEFSAKSDLQINPDKVQALREFLELFYIGTEHLNIVCKYIPRAGKASPCGGGRTVTRDQWLEYLDVNGIPETEAGAWIRPNPCAEKGSGKDGAITDSDIVNHRFLLVESDVLPLNVQLALFSKLKLPIACVILSGGLSAHAWVRIDAASPEEYEKTCRRILSALDPFGIDQGNRNPSRLSRLPSATRVIGAQGDGAQTLLWLNPGRKAVTQEDLETLEKSLSSPVVSDKPFKKIITDAVIRFQHLSENQGNLGVPTGFTEFDRDTGGLKPSQMIVIAGKTGEGKTTLAMNMLNGALRAKRNCALFTLEMDGDEIADLFFSMNCRVDRNHFNNGEFTEGEMKSMISGTAGLTNLPLWVYDTAETNASDIREKILQLKRDANLELVVVDYAQLIDPSDDDDLRERQVAKISKDLLGACRLAKVAMIVLSQLNDDGKIRESRAIAHDAHAVLLIDNKEEERRMDFFVSKGRRFKKKRYEMDYAPEYSLLTSRSSVADDYAKKY